MTLSRFAVAGIGAALAACAVDPAGPGAGVTPEPARVLADIGSLDAPVASDTVPERTAAAAFELAEQGSELAARLRGDRVVRIAVERLAFKSDAQDPVIVPHYLVTHYGYEGDIGYETIVDLDAGRVVDQTATPHLPVQLSEAEFERAREMTLSDPRVREVLGADLERVVVEPLVIRTRDREDPYFGRRVVRMLFRVGRDYRGDLAVETDLTEGRVHVLSGDAVRRDNTEGGGDYEPY